MAELKPCPFCGGRAEYVNYISNYERTPVCAVKCQDCGAMIDGFVSEDHTFAYKDKATDAWNRRADNGK